jgi:hypothetical protein
MNGLGGARINFFFYIDNSIGKLSKTSYQHSSLFNVIFFIYIHIKPFTIISNSDYLRKSDILVGSIVICLNKSILGYNSTEHCSQVVTFFK